MSFLVHTTQRLIAQREVRSALVPTVLARTYASSAPEQKGHRNENPLEKRVSFHYFFILEIRKARTPGNTNGCACNLLKKCGVYHRNYSTALLYTLTDLKIKGSWPEMVYQAR